ncbi:transcriptional regulator [Candidatus Bathycorpusculum sp.]|uniref:transcriptional regulator n=1 Tax=Candidatus Bathycorpusculum sp. TaxID=2994959 RepID=UPI0028381AD1|nr:transcriptional regulator [Candidatus Termitimicrobium sp.]MCL2685227.1 transcriptional regulator [Candidatus Termitimicrobium sp.]
MIEDEIQTLLYRFDRLSTKTVTPTRCLILSLLSYFIDGIQYRELKAALKISDGKLISNLNQLKTMGYITKTAVKIDKKTIDVYTLTEKGKKELNKIIEWTKAIETITNKET